MLATIIIISLAFTWLGFESDWFTVRLPVGKNKSLKDNWTPYYKELLARDNRPRSAGRTIAEWDKYEIEHANELAQERKEQAGRDAYYKAHTCPICKNAGATVIVETKTIVAGNSTCHVTGCPDCIAKYTKDIENSQNGKIRETIFKPCQLPLDAFIKTIRVGSHGYHRTADDYETVYHDCLVSKEWLKEHEHFEMPEPTIEITINDKTLPVNGNYKKGLIAGFMENYTEKVRAGKKTMVILKGGHVENMGGSCYVSINEPEELVEAGV